MTTVFPGALDSYADKVDGVDDVLAAHVNDMQDAIEALETHLQTKGMMTRVRNTSGATVAANDVGYIDYAGEFKTTTTAYINASWCVVISGAANNSDIIVCRKGRVTIELNGNCSAGDYLFTSTTTGQAQPQSYMRSEAFAVALTANSGGAGGTCEALLLTGVTYKSVTSSLNVLKFAAASASDFVSTIATLPGGAVLTYGAVTSGAENTIDVSEADQLSKLRLFNSTRSTYGLIDSVVVGTNTITLTANVDAGWQVGDTITTRSQTVTDPAPPPYFYDADLSSADNTVIPVLVRAIHLDVTYKDTGAPSYSFFHPWETYGTAKIKVVQNPVANQNFVRGIDFPLFQRRFSISWGASGAGTALIAVRLRGWWEATP